MAVFSEKEFQKKKEEIPPREGLPERVDSPPKEIIKVVLEKEHVFLHPEKPHDGSLDFEDEIMIKGKSVKRVCINGLIKTTNKLLIENLKQKGFYLLEVKEENNGGN